VRKRFGTRCAMKSPIQTKLVFTKRPLSLLPVNSMKTRDRVDLSKRHYALGFAACFIFLTTVLLPVVQSQLSGQDPWRRTSRGWEYAHAVQSNAMDNSPPSILYSSAVGWPDSETSNERVRRWHRLVLPIAVSSFMVTFGGWLLISVPNLAILRQRNSQ